MAKLVLCLAYIRILIIDKNMFKTSSIALNFYYLFTTYNFQGRYSQSKKSLPQKKRTRRSLKQTRESEIGNPLK